jgi:flagellar biosynthesis/type III secretory pathway M-ring protein FliF/YscJ
MSDIEDAKRGEQFNNMSARFTSLDKKIDEIGGTLKWVNRTILTGIILGVIAFLVRGGFNLP